MSIKKIINLLSNNVFTALDENWNVAYNILETYGSTLNIIILLASIPVVIFIYIKWWKSCYSNVYNHDTKKHNIKWTGEASQEWTIFWWSMLIPATFISIWWFGYILGVLIFAFYIVSIIYFFRNLSKILNWYNNSKLAFWIYDKQGKVEPDNYIYKQDLLDL